MRWWQWLLLAAAAVIGYLVLTVGLWVLFVHTARHNGGRRIVTTSQGRKPTGVCQVCKLRMPVGDRGKVQHHGPRANPCQGNGKSPLPGTVEPPRTT